MIVIVGGTSGIGFETAKYLMSKGNDVVVTGRHAPEDNDLNFQFMDVTDEGSIETFFNSIRSLNSLVYSAGITTGQKDISSFDKKIFNNIIDVNVTGLLLCLKHSIKLLKGSKGKVVALNSLAGRSYSQFSGVEYTISKTALSGLVKQLAVEFSKDGVIINSVFPAMTATPMLVKNVDKDVLEKVESRIPLKRIAQPLEIAKAIEFLISDDNTYITGSGIDINGGQFLNG